MNAVIKPPLTPLNPDNIPEALRRAKRWAPWAAPWDSEKQKYDKVPHRADRPEYGLSNGSTRGWVTFDQALAAYRARPDLFAGVGYLMTGRHGIVGVDLDHCRNPQTGEVAPWAAELIAKLDSYTEVSPSGTGLHVMLAGDLETDWSVKLGEKCAKQPGIDVYGGGARFLTVTGAHYPGSPRDVRARPAALDTLAARYRKSKDVAKLLVMPLPDVHDMDLPDVRELGLPAKVSNLLNDGPDPGADRSALLIATGVALAAAGLSPEESFALMVDNEHTMDIALSKRQYDDTKAREYLWTHHCRRGAAIYDTSRQLQLDEFDDIGVPAAVSDDLDDILGGPSQQAVPAAGQVADIVNDFEDLGPSEQQEQATPARDLSPVKVPRFTPVTPAMFLQRKPASWIIKGVLPRAGLAVVYGASGSGKTFFVLDLVGSVVRGAPWRGQPTQKGRGVYVVAEGASGFRNRLDAYCAHHCIDPAAFDIGVVADAPNLLDKGDMRDLIKALLAFGKIDFVVIDTYARAMAGGNENDAKDVGQAVAHCDVIHRKTGALVVLVHHSGKDASKGARGSGALRAAADLELEVIQTREYRAATVTKQKDGEDGKEFQFKLAETVIGEDEDGDAITSCVVEHRDGPTRRRPSKPLTPRQELVLRTLDECMALDDGLVHYSQLKHLVVGQIEHDPEKKVDNRGRDVGRDIDHLITIGLLQQTADGEIKHAEPAK